MPFFYMEKFEHTFKSFKELRNHFRLRENVWEIKEKKPAPIAMKKEKQSE